MGTMREMHTAAQRRRARGPSARAKGCAVPLAAAAVLALAWAPAAYAIPDPGVQARAAVNPDFACAMAGCAPVDDIEQGPTGPQHASAFAIGGFNGSGTATAAVNWGVMHLFSQFTNAGGAEAIGQNRDELTFSAPGVAQGTLMQVTFGVLVEGGGIQGGAGGGEGSWLLQADLGGGAFDINAEARDNAAQGYIGNPFGLFTATVTVEAGSPQPLDIELTAGTSSVTGGSAVADLADTLEWGGISKVTVGGVALTDYSVTSASGTNWADSFLPGPGVPEPATWAMMLVGFGGLGGLLRRRRSAAVAA
jgi:PEP-CTERM motif